MNTKLMIAVLSVVCAHPLPASAQAQSNPTSLRAVLQSPGGELPFRLDLVRGENGATPARAVIHNGSERIAVDEVEWTSERLMLRFAHYNSEIEATSSDSGATWKGSWSRRRRGDKITRLAFSASADAGYRFAPLGAAAEAMTTGDVAGRWLCKFSESSESAIGEFHREEAGAITGTLLTPGGDYGFLAGSFEHGRLRLSNFDGAHAFLFDALLKPEGTLAGGFWSGDTWHESWTAERAPEAKLPDGFSLAKATGKADLAALRFTELDGRERSLADVLGDGKAYVLEIFGSWCPNCHDASHLLNDLQRQYGERGLRVIGIAFEYTGDLQQDGKQVRAFIERHKPAYTIVYGGAADKEEIARKLPFLDEAKAYPTTIFLRADGTVSAIHTGFSGPATGKAHDELRAAFQRVIDEMLKG